MEVLAATNRFDGPPLYAMGMVEGEKQLDDFLDAVGIDCFIVSSGEPCTPSFTSTTFDRSPKRIVENLKELFERADELPLKILSGEQLTDEEKSFRAPASLAVCASAVRIDEDQRLERVAAWFKKKR